MTEAFELLEIDIDSVYQRVDITLSENYAKEWVNKAPFARKYVKIKIFVYEEAKIVCEKNTGKFFGTVS